jgi:hypothetical protein
MVHKQINQSQTLFGKAMMYNNSTHCQNGWCPTIIGGAGNHECSVQAAYMMYPILLAPHTVARIQVQTNETQPGF